MSFHALEQCKNCFIENTDAGDNMRAFDQSTLSVISLDILESLEKLLQLLLLLRHLCCLCPFSLRHQVSLLSLWTCQQPHLHHTRAMSLPLTEARLSLRYSNSSPIKRPAINTRRPIDPFLCKNQERLLHRKVENQSKQIDHRRESRQEPTVHVTSPP